jgi:hypothetical protein
MGGAFLAPPGGLLLSIRFGTGGCLESDRCFRQISDKLNVQFNDKHAQSSEQMVSQLGTPKAGVLKTARGLLDVAIWKKRESNTVGDENGDQVVKEIIGME